MVCGFPPVTFYLKLFQEEWVVTIAQLIPLFYKERVDLNKDAQINVSALELSENNAGKDLYSPVSVMK